MIWRITRFEECINRYRSGSVMADLPPAVDSNSMPNFLRDEHGAAPLESTVLNSVILGGALSVLPVAGPWLGGEWSILLEARACVLPEAAEHSIPPGHEVYPVSLK